MFLLYKTQSTDLQLVGFYKITISVLNGLTFPWPLIFSVCKDRKRSVTWNSLMAIFIK